MLIFISVLNLLILSLMLIDSVILLLKLYKVCVINFMLVISEVMLVMER